VNIVDLGLVYGVTIQGDQVNVRMTLTTPGCPLQTKLARWAKIVVLRLDGVETVNVDVVWDPPWDPSMMSAAAKAQVGGGMCWGGG
jgi:metal-sulfur cluster biosynthetic enzyme